MGLSLVNIESAILPELLFYSSNIFSDEKFKNLETKDCLDEGKLNKSM